MRFYLGRRRNAYIHGLALEDSEALLDALWSHATQENLVWHHTWRVGRRGDLGQPLHHASPGSVRCPHARRVMHRAQAHDGLRPAREPSAGRAVSHPRGLLYFASRAAKPA